MNTEEMAMHMRLQIVNTIKLMHDPEALKKLPSMLHVFGLTRNATASCFVMTGSGAIGHDTCESYSA